MMSGQFLRPILLMLTLMVVSGCSSSDDQAPELSADQEAQLEAELQETLDEEKAHFEQAAGK